MTTMARSVKEVSFSKVEQVDVVRTKRDLKGTSSYSHFTGDRHPVGLKVPVMSVDTLPGAHVSAAPGLSATLAASVASAGQGQNAAKKLVNYLHRLPRESRAMAETLNPVERDGLVENIYELLRTLSSSHDGQHSRFTALRLPDTVIIRNGLIYKWYFTSKNGHVLRKNRSRLHREEVRDALLAKGAKNRSKIVAVYLTSTSARVKPGQRPGDEEHTPSPTTPGRPEDINTHTPVVHCDYLDAKQLRLFLDDDVLQRNGILQAFIEPNTDRMSTIEATFSPAATLIERRLNVNKVDDYRFPAVERMVTFDGADHLSDLVPVQRPQTVAGLKDGCRAIKEHIAGVGPFYLDVGRMVLYLREDNKRQIWLLWCTSFRCTPRPDDPLETNHGPLALHTRMTVDKSGEEGSTRRREKAAGVGSANLEEKSRVPTTGVVVQDPADGLREWGPDVATTNFTEEERQKAERRHLVYNIPPVGLLDNLFEPGASTTAGRPDGYQIKDKNDEDDAATSRPFAQKPEKRQCKSASHVSSTGAKISDTEKHRSTRLTKGMQLASGELYNDALLICQTAPDLEALKSTEQRHSERHVAAQTLWNAADEKAREREAVVAKLLLQQEKKKQEELHTYKVRVLKKHRGIDGINTDTSLTLNELAPEPASDDVQSAQEVKQYPYEKSAAEAGSGKPSLTVEVPDGKESQDPSNDILTQLGYSEDSPGEVDPEVQKELDMLRGLPRNHPTMLEFIRRQRQKIAKGENLVITTDESNKKASERKARLIHSSMGRTDMKSQSPNKISKEQLLEVTRRHTNKLPTRWVPSEGATRPGSAPVRSAQGDTGLNATEPRRRVRPVSANVSATTAARWGVHTGTVMVDEAAALQTVADRHSKAIKAAENSVPKPQRPLWKSRESATTSSGAGGLKQVTQMRARGAGAGSRSQQRVPVPPATEKEQTSSRSVRPEIAPSGRTEPLAATEITTQRRAAAELRYRKLLGYDDKPDHNGETYEQAARPAHQHRKVVTRPGSATQASTRPGSALPIRTRPTSARPISSAFGDSTPAAAGGHTGIAKRRVQSARVRTNRVTAADRTTGGRSVRARPQSAVVPGRTASSRSSRQTGSSGDAWLKNVLVQTQSLIASVKRDQELYSAEADALQGQLYERAGMNVAAYQHVRVPQ